MQHPEDQLLTPEYYTRFHIWQTIVKQMDEIPWNKARELAEAGFEFVWKPESIYTMTEEDKDKRDEVSVFKIDPSGGSYL